MLTFIGKQNGVDEFETAEEVIDRLVASFMHRVVDVDSDKVTVHIPIVEK